MYQNSDCHVKVGVIAFEKIIKIVLDKLVPWREHPSRCEWLLVLKGLKW